MATDTEKEMNQIKSDIAELRKDFAALTSTLKTEAGDKARRGYQRAREAGEEAQDYARAGAREVESHIEERPFTSVLSAFGIGFIIGKLMDR